MSRRRLDAEQSLDAERSRALILDAVERLMAREGYAVVNSRRVALEASVKPTLVHCRFDTTDNLLLEAYLRSALLSEEMLREAMHSDKPQSFVMESSIGIAPRSTLTSGADDNLGAHRYVTDSVAERP